VTPLVVTSENRSVAIFHTSREVLACDPASGKVRWTLASEGVSTIPSPTESDGLIIIPGYPTRALKPGKDGTEPEMVWTSNKLIGGHPSPVSYQGRIYGLAGAVLNCVNAKDGTDVWALRLPGKFAAGPVIAGGRAYIVTQEGLTLVVSLADKPAIVARNALGDPMLATPAICDGCIYLRSDKALYCVGGSKGS
jgi:outer membrane protein assembly factor BamB